MVVNCDFSKWWFSVLILGCVNSSVWFITLNYCQTMELSLCFVGSLGQGTFGIIFACGRVTSCCLLCARKSVAKMFDFTNSNCCLKIELIGHKFPLCLYLYRSLWAGCLSWSNYAQNGRTLGSRTCSMRASKKISIRVSHVPRDDFEGGSRGGKVTTESTELVACHVTLCQITNTFCFCFWTFDEAGRRFSSFLWIPNTLCVRNQMMSRNSGITGIAIERNLILQYLGGNWDRQWEEQAADMSVTQPWQADKLS